MDIGDNSWMMEGMIRENSEPETPSNARRISLTQPQIPYFTSSYIQQQPSTSLLPSLITYRHTTSSAIVPSNLLPEVDVNVTVSTTVTPTGVIEKIINDEQPTIEKPILSDPSNPAITHQESNTERPTIEEKIQSGLSNPEITHQESNNGKQDDILREQLLLEDSNSTSNSENFNFNINKDPGTPDKTIGRNIFTL